MPHSRYLEDLDQTLRLIRQKIDSAWAKFDAADPAGKAEALDELIHLRDRHEAIARRMAEARKKGADQWSDLHASLREEVDAISDTLENWLTRFD